MAIDSSIKNNVFLLYQIPILKAGWHLACFIVAGNNLNGALMDILE
jgi:hypothetical protein